MEKEKVKGIPYGVASFEQLRSCFEFLQKVFLGLMYPFSCVLWAIFWSFPLLIARYLPHHRSGNPSKTHPNKSSHDKFKTASKARKFLLRRQDNVSSHAGGDKQLPFPYTSQKIRKERICQHDAGVLRHCQSGPVRYTLRRTLDKRTSHTVEECLSDYLF